MVRSLLILVMALSAAGTVAATVGLVRELRRTRRSHEAGASAVEYALIVALVAGVFIAGAAGLQDATKKTFRHSACDTNRGYYCAEVP